MKQRRFEQQYRPEWDHLAAQLARLEQRTGRGTMENAALADLPQRYRRLCHLQALARERGYSPTLIDELDSLMLRAHRQLYRQQPPLLSRLRAFLVAGFPGAIRSQWRWMLASAAVFLVSTLFVFLLVRQQPDMIYSVLDEPVVANIEQLYNPAGDTQQQHRGADQDTRMFGYYIMNNIGLAFRTFAGGLFLGVGALFVMLFNGSFLGAVAAHLMNLGYQQTFFTFIVAHSAPELTAIVLAGGAGLRLGWSVVAPGPFSRLEALRQAAHDALPVMYGVFGLLVIAAFTEAFWSPRDFAPVVKYGVGAAVWLLLYLYLGLAGRGRD